MFFSVLFLVILFTAIAAWITNRIKKNDEHEKMMSKVYTVHGHILKTTWNKKPATGIGSVGSSVSTDGTYYTHYTYNTYNRITGFTVHFLVDFTTADMHRTHMSFDSQPVTTFCSLYQGQENPFLSHAKGPLEELDGTLSYVVDKNGQKYYYSFTPD